MLPLLKKIMTASKDGQIGIKFCDLEAFEIHGKTMWCFYCGVMCKCVKGWENSEDFNTTPLRLYFDLYFLPCLQRRTFNTD